MIKIINNFNCNFVFSKTYGRLFKLPFQSMISYGSSKAVYYKNNYEINCMNGLNLDLVDSKTVSQSIKSIFDRYEHKNYINLYENDIDNNMNMIINEFNCKEYIDDINFHVAIETDIRVINKDELIMEDAVELLSIIPVVSIIKDGKVLTKTFKSMCRLEDGFEKAFNKLRVMINSLLEDSIEIDLSGKFELIFSPSAAGMLFHETIGHALESDFFIEENCFLRDFYNSKVFPEILNLDDIPLFRRFDDDGNMCNNVTLIEKGKIVGLLYNEILSNANNSNITGNGFKSRDCDVVIPRMRNLKVRNGTDTIEDILHSTNKGIYIENIHCGDINIGTGEISLLIDNAYLIENGKKTSKIKDFTYYGNALEIIKNIKMIGNDYDYKIDKCNKKGQLITVGYGSPTIKIEMMDVLR
ncbi:MAG: TldD/PmbA family protein [Romboutsia timonensis]